MLAPVTASHTNLILSIPNGYLESVVLVLVAARRIKRNRVLSFDVSRDLGRGRL